MTFEIGKEYQTRDGRKAKVLGTMPNGWLCGWLVLDTPSGYVPYHWLPDGTSLGTREDDLVNVPERTVKVWIDVYPITFTVGEGLEPAHSTRET